MKLTIKRNGFNRHNFNPEEVHCPDCPEDNSLTNLELTNFEYIQNHYKLTYVCSKCLCEFEIETDTLKSMK